MESSVQYRGYFVYSMVISAAMGSFFFGYILGVFNNSQKYIDIIQFPGMSKSIRFFLTSFVPLGAGIGAFLAGQVSERLGRRKAMFLTDFISIIGLIIQLIPVDIFLLIGRLVCGFCVGLNSAIVPQYINEVAPVKIKGTAGTIHQVAINVGIIISYLIPYGLPSSPQPGDDRVFFWNIVLGFPFLTVGYRILTMLVLYRQDTPRYCLSQGNEEEARAIVERIYEGSSIDEQFQILKNQAESEKQKSVSSSSNSSVGFKSRFRSAFILSTFQQLSGINALIFFSNSIFTTTSGAEKASLYTLILGLVNLTFTLVATQLIERAGRKFLTSAGIMMMGLMLVAFATLNIFDNTSFALVILIFGYIIFFALSMGPVSWPFIAELLFDKGVNIAVLGNWACAFIVAQSFDYLQDLFSVSGVFYFYAAFAFVGGILISTTMHETKGKTDAEIDQLYGGKPLTPDEKSLPLTKGSYDNNY